MSPYKNLFSTPLPMCRELPDVLYIPAKVNGLKLSSWVFDGGGAYTRNVGTPPSRVQALAPLLLVDV